MAHTQFPEREAVRKAYPTQKWAAKVDKMDDQQVFAIYIRLKKQNKV